MKLNLEAILKVRTSPACITEQSKSYELSRSEKVEHPAELRRQPSANVVKSFRTDLL